MRTNLRVIALICFILPILTVIISYIASVKLNLVPACIPNFEGCTSISRAGRNVPVKYFFKPMMYLYSFILFLYWYKFLEILNKFKISEKKFSFFSFFSVLFLKALNDPELASSIVFPLVNMGVIVSSSIIGMVLFKEKLSRNNWIGIFLSICAIYIFSI